MVNDAALLLKHLQIDKAHIVGLSMGGMIAEIVAAQHAVMCFSLTLIVTGVTGYEDSIRRVGYTKYGAFTSRCHDV